MPAVIALLLLLLVMAVGEGGESFCDNRCSSEGLATARACHCDKACLVYDDCCSDSKYLLLNRSELELSTEVACKRDALTVSACSTQWKGPDFIAKSCAGSSGGADPVGNAPVTSRDSGATYANYHCAICNGDAGDVWSIQLSCPQLQEQLQNASLEEAFQYIFYNHPTGEWGYVRRDDDTKKTSFHGCALAYEAPGKLQGAARACPGIHREEEIAECPPAWKLDTVREMCARYSDPVFAGDGGRRYRNFYCAVCNGVDQSTLRCGGGSRPRTGLEEGGGNKLSFSMLLDIDFSEGNEVGKMAARCLPGEVFDPFARRCRNIVCGIPGFVIQNGLCVPAAERPL